ncbi:efflux RND transporter periplasmic adaptor subunit [Calycomorphotria hydatis]|uniref:Cobalt-zinc-cadmium resistance protein CzcB n=1 Tax=Calycomorphotria hydatis TaxID=2528027 RepID=A0A517TE42_9PLAN|nr:efflux RND transporter periplasmic adaptor subunit [Calycomorphotria hydatis]QDT66640.1 Cobalt-zinc-cadmium resistance protein CzcB [Calycomorphotria hydatis]
MSQVVADRPTAESSVSTPREVRAEKASPPQSNGFVRLGRWIFRVLPTLLVMCGLAAIGAYGHANHWKLPSFAELTGNVEPVALDWCEEHGVPEANCVACNPDLMPVDPVYGWCNEHGVHNCTLHHPDVAELKDTPKATEEDFRRAAEALSLRDRPHNNATCKVYQRRIQFASVDAVQQAGVDVELVEREPVTEWVSGNGEIRYDATRLASLSSRVVGTAWRVIKNIGDPVREGEVLAVVDAMEVGRLKGDLMKAIVAEELARKNVERLTGLSKGVVPGKDILETEAVLAKAEAEVLSTEQALANLGLPVDVSSYADLSKNEIVDRLRFLGIPQALADQFRPETATANLIPVRSPMDGVIVERSVVPGEVVDPTRTLFEVADPSRMWLILNVPLEEARLLEIGQSVHFLPNGSLDEVSGTLSWISTAADRQTRMVKVRAELENTDGQLRDETFGAGRIVLRKEPEAIVVPQQAVHWEGCCQVVFVRDEGYFDSPESPKVFHLRSVRTGVKNDGSVEIIAGLLPGEVIVTEGSDVLRAQLLKNSLGAGCCAE